ncbi:hypothetical protein [Thermogutta sp.]|uniref:hypothetical protein n=1 Tax=Thermogutta sp. TaxID=1962930 RepID=UPI003C7CDECD
MSAKSVLQLGMLLLVACGGFAVVATEVRTPPPSTRQEASLQNPGTSANSAAEKITREASSLTGPRAVLKRLGISDSMWEGLEDGQPLQPQEHELLLRLLFHMRMFQPAELEEWKQPPPEWNAIAADTRAWRGKLLEIKGTATEVAEESVPAEVAQRLGLHHYYACRVATENGEYLVYARDVPRAWKTIEQLREATVIRGLFLKLVKIQPKPVPLLVTDRPSWFPNNLLGRLGMDCSLFDDVGLGTSAQRFVTSHASSEGGDEPLSDPLEKYRLTGKDRECFYQLLAAVGRAEPGQLLREAQAELARMGKSTYSVVPLFNDPVHQQGKLFLLYGTARRIEKVSVEDPDIRKRFGIDHYHTIYLFTDDSQNYPIVFCVRYLPKGVVPGEGPGYAVNLAVAGFFMKTWAFRPQAALSPDAPRNAWQLAPLLIGREAVRLAADTSSRQVGTVTTILTGVVVVVVVLIGAVVWWFNRQDKKREWEIRQRLFSESSRAETSPSDRTSSNSMPDESNANLPLPDRPG